MTLKELWQGTKVRLNKTESPSIQLEPWNQIVNEAIWDLANEVYDQFNTDQERTDSLPELNTFVELTITGSQASPVTLAGDISEVYASSPVLVEDTTFGKKFILPDNYWHLTSLIITYTSTVNQKCFTANSRPTYSAKRLSRDSEAAILNNEYLRPKFDRPYFVIYRNPSVNVNVPGSNKITGVNNSTIEVLTGVSPTLIPSKIRVTYLKVPEYLTLTYEEAHMNDIIPGSAQDVSPVLEFPNHICKVLLDRIIERIKLITNDPSIQSEIPYNQSQTPLKPRQQ